ncbi:MAG: hypothetical protein IKQ61_02100 [Spirochaetales bacterium]|nr:hypothetical protein [Spirochaetales bacterium]
MKKIFLFCLSVIFGLFLIGCPQNQEQTEQVDMTPSFWDNANVYFALIDRFYNGDVSNDTAYNRPKGIYNTDADATKYYGGDIKGLTEKLDYIYNLGINAIWITAPYEQIHGDTGGSYPYHGYWTLDWTQMDASVGTAEEFRTFVDTAHSKGIRVIMDVVMNHPGYATLEDLKNLVASGTGDLITNDQINHKSCELHNWWGIDWLRAGLCEHYTTGDGDLQGSCGGYLPDFITEGTKTVSLSPMFTRKLADKVNYPRDGYKVTDLTNDDSESGRYRMRDYIIKWLSDWVREFGIDGFRCDTAKHVEKDAWYQLKTACVQALREWKSNNPNKKIDDLDFWMTGEHFDHGVSKDDYFTVGGFDSMINFSLRSSMGKYIGKIESINNIYSNYASSINSDRKFNVLTYISSHDTSLCYGKYAKTADELKTAGSLLTFCPGAIQIYYGDECGRKVSKAKSSEQQTRSQMPWDEDGYRSDILGYDFDNDVYTHWSKVLNFRKNHIAIGAGTHNKIADTPYIFSRIQDDDKVVIVLGATPGESIEVDVSSIGASSVRDYYTGVETAVSNDKAVFTVSDAGVVLIEKAN